MKREGFSLVELMVAMAVSALLMILLLGAVQQVSRLTRRASATSTAFDDARIAFGEMQSRLAQATLSPYWNVSYTGGNPSGYSRYSDLHFITGSAASLVPSARQTRGASVFFQAPTGFEPTTSRKDSGLNAVGFFVEYRDANTDMPLSALHPSRWRFQLREFRQPSSGLKVFDATDPTGRQWFQSPLSATNAPLTTLAENILLLIVRARTVDGGKETVYYDYDSRLPWSGNQPPTSHQLPGLLDVVMVACDEATGERLAGNGTMPTLRADLFADPAKLDTDTSALESSLAQSYPGGVFRTFRATVPIRSAKWSINATNL